MPFILLDDYPVTLDSNVILGGVEKFAKDLYDNFDIIPVYINKSWTRSKRAFNVISQAIIREKPDLIISNYDKKRLTVDIQEKFNIPVIWIAHIYPGSFSSMSALKYMHNFMKVGGTLVGVSNKQCGAWNDLSKRLIHNKLEFNGGIIKPCFSQSQINEPTKFNKDLITIGRVDKIKDPFHAHKIGSKLNMPSRVFTMKITNAHDKKYDFSHLYTGDQITVYNMNHDDIMKQLSNSGVYIGTCTVKTFGITALEALSHGVPVLLCTDTSLTHSSESIIPKSVDAIQVIKKSAPIKEYHEKINYLLSKTIEERFDISRQTIEENSKKKWIKNLNNLFENTIRKFKKENTIFDLLSR